MTLIASLLFAIALVASIGVIVLTIGNAMPRIREAVDMEFAPVVQSERQIIFGELKMTKPVARAEVITFPRKIVAALDHRLAA
ncbi:MAG: hypothetical protein IBJ12_07645 [Sphingomonadaceae bacterium]|nr:hypothetical protein [Sphingomonadaceae bacterium]